MSKTRAVVASLLILAAPAMAQTISIDAMRDHRRVLVVSAPAADDPLLVAQRADIATWHGAADRDVSTVQIVGDRVQGASDAAGTLRARYDLPHDRFAVILIGKDGHVGLRSANPISAATLNGTIDAMPMRRAGQR